MVRETEAEVVETQRFDGFLLSFDKKEFVRIKDYLSYCGYEPDSTGLKQMILDTVTKRNGPEKRVGTMLGDLLADNPQVVDMGINMASNALKRILTKRK